jgi:hypothetical protein
MTAPGRIDPWTASRATPVVLIQHLLANCSLSQNTVEFHDPPAIIELGHAATTVAGG